MIYDIKFLTKSYSLFWFVNNKFIGNKYLISFWSIYSKIFANFNIFYKDFLPGFRYNWFKTLFKKDIYISFFAKYMNIFEFLSDFSPGFFKNNNYFICAIY